MRIGQLTPQPESDFLEVGGRFRGERGEHGPIGGPDPLRQDYCAEVPSSNCQCAGDTLPRRRWRNEREDVRNSAIAISCRKLKAALERETGAAAWAATEDAIPAREACFKKDRRTVGRVAHRYAVNLTLKAEIKNDQWVNCKALVKFAFM